MKVLNLRLTVEAKKTILDAFYDLQSEDEDFALLLAQLQGAEAQTESYLVVGTYDKGTKPRDKFYNLCDVPVYIADELVRAIEGKEVYVDRLSNYDPPLRVLRFK